MFFVTSVLLALTLPPTIPLWMAGVGVVFAVIFGKMAFGGFATNIFNPALVGRCFLYIAFPLAMTAGWVNPKDRGVFPAGLAAWRADAVTSATPLDTYKAKEPVDLAASFLGNEPGSLGETSALLIALGGAYLLIRRVASPWIVGGCLAGGIVSAAILHAVSPAQVGGPLFQLLTGGFLFGAFFMATDPVSAAKTNPGRLLYGILIGALTVVLRGYSNFSCGFTFAVLLGNMFAPLMDAGVREYQAWRRAAAAPAGPTG